MDLKETNTEWFITEKATKKMPMATINKSNRGFINVYSLGNDTIEETNATALLISKAPEMLEMIKSIVSEFSHYKSAHGTSKCGAILRAEELIKEATEI